MKQEQLQEDWANQFSFSPNIKPVNKSILAPFSRQTKNLSSSYSAQKESKKALD